ncbi:hypothetical protein L0Y34_01025 [Candidatus Parcubacteria bacterium]|nr:hypothetical protein [Candidatus Parcubacteria bacterium]
MKSPAFIHCILSLMLALICVGAYLAWFFEINRAASRVTALEVDIAQKHDEQTQLIRGQDVFAALEADETSLASHFVPTNNIVAFLEDVESTGDAFGAAVSVLSVTETNTKEQLSLALSFSGTFSAVMKTLGALEYGRYGSATDSLTLDTTGDGSWTAALTLLVSAPETP